MCECLSSQMDRVNLKRLAKELNLAVSTVSRALSDSHEISVETKEKVLKLAKELKYNPNPYARSLRKKNSNTIAVIVPEVASNFFSKVINGIEEIAHEQNFHVLFYITHEDAEREAYFLKHLISGRVDGILMSLSGDGADIEHLNEIRSLDMPVVFFDRIAEDFPTAKITTNDFESGYAATKHLLDKGCKDVMYLGFSAELSISSKRLDGYRSALHDAGMAFKSDNIVNCSHNNDANVTLISDVLRSGRKVDGFFSAAEPLALSLYEACLELNLNIPGDIKVISFSNMRAASLLNPPLSTITQPAFEIGYQAASALFRALRDKKLVDEKIVLTSQLIERRSTAG